MSLPEHERRIIQYLLGRLSEEERFEMERRYFKDPASLEEMEAVELDLIERFLDGDLSPLLSLPKLREVLVARRKHYSHTAEQLERGKA